jgi:hypothetical protein
MRPMFEKKFYKKVLKRFLQKSAVFIGLHRICLRPPLIFSNLDEKVLPSIPERTSHTSFLAVFDFYVLAIVQTPSSIECTLTENQKWSKRRGVSLDSNSSMVSALIWKLDLVMSSILG